MRPLLTVLTDPLPVGRFLVKETLKRAARPLRDLLRPRPIFLRSCPYRGHFGVTRSLVEGLRKINVSANYNPDRMAEVGPIVVILSGINALKQAITWKRQGRIDRLLAGPNILVLPSDYPDVISLPEVDICITPSDWVSRAYEDECPALAGRCSAWPAGVNTEYWQPAADPRCPNQVLLYAKRDISLIPICVSVLERRHYNVRILAYGSHDRDEYRDALRQSSLLIGFSTSESQGLAWAEAWSVDVPTLLWFQDHHVWHGRTLASSTAPYLSPRTGLFFTSVPEFESALTGWETTKAGFLPRRWVLENMSDEICAQRLCHLAGVDVG